MKTSRMETFKHKFMWDFRCRIWWGVFCMIVFGGEPFVGIRSSQQDMLENNSSSGAVDGTSAHIPSRIIGSSAEMLLNTGYEITGMENNTYYREEVTLRCDVHDLEITTSISRHLPNGIPMFSVEIANTCIYCSFKDIHVACGEWASQSLVNPKLFRRLHNNDCLVKNGNALAPKDIVFFEYSNSFSYDLRPKHARRVCRKL